MKRIPPKVLQSTKYVNGRMIVTVTAALILYLFLTFSTSLNYIPDEMILSSIGIFPVLPKQNQTRNIPVFYNVFIANQKEHDRVQRLVMDQLSYLKPYHHPIYVHTIGYPILIPNTTLLQHHTNASELVSLHSLWRYCQTHPTDQVVYLHSKGSYHPSNENDRLRQLSTMAALSDDCAIHTDNIISNLCSYRISPFPHPHVPGNMWLAHCSYINHLMEPTAFYNNMKKVQAMLVLKPDAEDYCVGNGRYAAEHWIHSHPNVKPSDLYTNQNYTWGYDGLREKYQEGDFEWKLAPRYDLGHWPIDIACEHSDLIHRLKEYRLLYNITPQEDWWGWNFWLGPNQKPHWPAQPSLRRDVVRQKA